MLRKCIACLFVILILVSCTAQSNDGKILLPTASKEDIQPSAFPPTATSLPPTEIPTATLTPAPTATSLPPDLAGSFDYPSRVVPTTIDPSKQTDEMIKGYRMAVQDDTYDLEWYGAAVTQETGFHVWLTTLSKNPKEKIDLKFPVRATITLMDIPADNLNVVSPMGGGGGGPINDMQPFIITPGQIDISPKGEVTDEFQYDTMLDIGHYFSFTCGQTGVFNIHFEFPYLRVAEDGGKIENVFPYDVIFACPASFTQFYVDTVEGVTKHTIKWVVKDGEYIQESE